MEKITQYVILGIFLAIVVMSIYSVYIYRIGDSQKLTGSEVEFLSLCSRWQNTYNCNEEKLAEIDATQELYNLNTLTELCFDIYDQGDYDKTIIICEDVCRNSCSANFYSDVGLTQNDINLVGNDYSITVTNYGTITAYDVNMNIYKIDENDNIFSKLITLRPKQTYNKKISSDTRIKVVLKYDDEIASNNIAESYI